MTPKKRDRQRQVTLEFFNTAAVVTNNGGYITNSGPMDFGSDDNARHSIAHHCPESAGAVSWGRGCRRGRTTEACGEDVEGPGRWLKTFSCGFVIECDKGRYHTLSTPRAYEPFRLDSLLRRRGASSISSTPQAPGFFRMRRFIAAIAGSIVRCPPSTAPCWPPILPMPNSKPGKEIPDEHRRYPVRDDARPVRADAQGREARSGILHRARSTTTTPARRTSTPRAALPHGATGRHRTSSPTCSRSTSPPSLRICRASSRRPR